MVFSPPKNEGTPLWMFLTPSLNRKSRDRENEMKNEKNVKLTVAITSLPFDCLLTASTCANNVPKVEILF